MNIVRKLFLTRVAAAFVVFAAPSALLAAPANGAVVFAGVCPTTAILIGNQLHVESNNCVYAPLQSSARLTADGTLAPILPLGICSTGVYESSATWVDAAANEWGHLRAVNAGTLTLTYVSDSGKMAFLGELAPSGMNGTCPNAWTGVVVIEDPDLSG